MKKSLVVVLVTFLVACIPADEAKVEMASNEYQQMLKETAQRDSAMIELVKTLNLIDENIEKIAEKKKRLDVDSRDPEMTPTYREKILDEIQEIYEMMQINKQKIAELNNRLADTRNKLSESDKELKHANELIKQYQVMIDNMNKKIDFKDEEIEVLQYQLSIMDISLDSLRNEYETQTGEMNTVYYAFGSKKELIYHKVIDKTGGFIGIGRSLQLKDDFNKEYFTKSDLTELEEIELYVKKADVLSTHDTASYHFEMQNEKITKLIIDDPEVFWSASKYLVVQVDQ